MLTVQVLTYRKWEGRGGNESYHTSEQLFFILLRVLMTNKEGTGLDERVYLLLICTTSNYT
jgi:hypothetical protein